MAYQSINTAFPVLYEAQWRQALQQMSSRTAAYVNTTPVNGKYKRFHKFEKSEMVPITVRMGTTNPNELGVEYRSLRTSFFKDAKRVDRREAMQLGELGGPQAAIQQAQRMSAQRNRDQVLINGLLGPSWEGEDGTTSTPFPATQSIPANFITGAPSGSGSNTGLIFDKLLRVKELFGAANINGQSVEGGSNIIGLITHRQLTDLLSTEKWTSGFYQNTKPLGGDGNIYNILDMTLVCLDPALLPVDSGGVRQCVFYSKDHVVFGVSEDIIARASELVDGNYDWQLYVECGWGATRLYDEGVLKVLCDEVA